MRELIITSQEEGQRLDRYLARYLPETSSAFLHKMLRKKNIKRNQGKASGSEKLMAGDRIQIYFSEETMNKFGAPSIGEEDRNNTAEGLAERNGRLTSEQIALREQVKILYQDEDIIILHKPAGMLTQKAKASDDSINDFLVEYWREEIMKGKILPASFRPSTANRLDRNTSGIVLCGITVKGLTALSDLLKNRNLNKYYLCLVKGQVSGSKKAVAYLKKDKKENRVEITAGPKAGSSRIETWYESISSSREASLLKVRLVTGKSHQIRAHLSYLGHPILGDAKYGDPGINRRLYKHGIHSQLLHSSELLIPQDLAKDQTPATRQSEHKENTPAVPKTPLEKTPQEQIAGLHIKDPLPPEFLRILKLYNLCTAEETVD